MTNKEMMWLKHTGKIGACGECPFRKPIDEMNIELLPCNQYQCLVKLARLDEEESHKNDKDEHAVADEKAKVKNAHRFNIVSRQQLPIKFMNSAVDETILNERYVGKTFGTYHVLEFAGYEFKEVSKGRETAGNEYINYIFKCQCVRCGSIRYLTIQGIQMAGQKKSACRNCWKIPDGDERLIQWDK